MRAGTDKRSAALVTAFLIAVDGFAEDAQMFDFDFDNTEWYERPWCCVGVVVFVVIVLLILRRPKE